MGDDIPARRNSKPFQVIQVLTRSWPEPVCLPVYTCTTSALLCYIETPQRTVGHVGSRLLAVYPASQQIQSVRVLSVVTAQ